MKGNLNQKSGVGLLKVGPSEGPEDSNAWQGHYLEGHGDLVSRIIMGSSMVIIWIIGFINLLTRSP